MSDYGPPESQHFLAKKWFLTFCYDPETGRRSIDWQGHVVAVEVASQGKLMAICRLFSWIDGSPTYYVAIDVNDMLVHGRECRFAIFDNEEAWMDRAERESEREARHSPPS